MEVSEHIDALRRDGELLADAAEQAGLAARVPSCPGWQVRDLVRHQGYVHGWATSYVAEQLPEWVPRSTEPEILAAEPPDAELLGWFRAGHARLVAALTNADPELSCWSFLPAPSPRAFWARRQAHETAIHRVDAELARGELTAISGDFAADGIDELIMGFFGRDAKKLTDKQRAGARRSFAVLATDTGGEWLVELTEDGTLAASVRRGQGEGRPPGQQGGGSGGRPPGQQGAADCTLAGPASGLYLLLWNRADPDSACVQVTGDPAVLTTWRDAMRVTWE